MADMKMHRPCVSGRTSCSQHDRNTASHSQASKQASPPAISPAMATPPPIPLQSIHVTLIRHGQSVDNLNGIWAGHKDSPLTSNGIAQARALAQSYATVRLDAIYSSDLKRASQTALELLNTQSLREQYFGTAEGRPVREAETSNPSHIETARDAAFPAGETLNAVNARLATAVRRFILPRLEGLRGVVSGGSDTDTSTVPHVCIVAHGIAIAELLRVFMAAHDSQSEYGEPWPHPQLTYQRARLDNTGWTRLELSVPAAHARPVAQQQSFPPTSLRPPTRDVFVRFVGQQNNTDHLRRLATSVTGSGNSRPSTTAQHVPPPPPSLPPPTHPHNTYSAGFMSEAIVGGGGKVDHDDTHSGDGPLSTALSQYYSLSGGGDHNQQQQQKTGPPSNVTNLSSFLSAYQLPRWQEERSSTAAAAAAAPQSSRHHHNAGTPLVHLPNFILSPSAMPAPGPGSNTDLWRAITQSILPLFKGEGLRAGVTIEDINDLISQHIRHTLDRGPARAWSSLSSDLRTLLMTGMLTLDSRIIGSATTSDDSTLLIKLSQCWSIFVHSILPWLEAAFLPLGTDPILLSLASAIGSSSSANANATTSANSTASQSGMTSPNTTTTFSSSSTPTAHLQLPTPSSSSTTPVTTTTSPPTGTLTPATPASVTSGIPPTTTSTTTTTGAAPTPTPPSLLRSQRIDVRKVSLSIFRDSVLLPNFERLFYLFSRIADVPLGGGSTTTNLGLGLNLSTVGGGIQTPNNRNTEEDKSSTSSISHRLTQMTHRIRAVQSGDEPQQATDALLRALRVGVSGAGGTSNDPRGNTTATATATSPNTTPSTDTQARRRGWMPRSAAKHGVHAQPQAHAPLEEDDDDGGEGQTHPPVDEQQLRAFVQSV